MTPRSPRRSPGKKRRTLLLVIVPAVVVTGCAEGNRTPTKKTKRPPLVKSVRAEQVTLADRLELTGSVEPTRVARMASPVEGPVIACLVREGDRVRAGQLLAGLGRAKGDDAVAASARAELEKEALELDRVEKLVRTGALPGEELDKARVKASAARASLARAMERLSDYRITAPWSGVVSRVHVAVGDFVPARATLVELFDPKSLVLQFAVPEKKAALIRNGASITVLLDAFPGRTFKGTVTRVYPEIDRRTHTRTVEGSIEGEVALAPGMFARLDLTLSSVPAAIAVPAESVLRRPGHPPVVFVITKEGLAEKRPVKPGIEDGRRVQILSGVKNGELIAVAGHGRLRDRMKVRLVRGQETPRPGKARSPGTGR
jgi:RND family efflux transporter MFP subunit